MRHSTLSVISVVLAASPILAAPPAPTTNPASPPLEVAAAPTEAGTILVFPLTEGSGGNSPWVGKAVQQDLVAELSRTTRSHVLAAKTPPADAEAAVKAGREASAALVVHGQFQSVGGQMRFTGQVLDVASGKATGGFTATGQATDLFPLEDAVTGQVLHALPAAWLTVALPPENANPSGQGNEASPPTPRQPPPSAPTSTAQTPEYYSYTYPDYSSGAPAVDYQNYGGYPYYGYGYPYYGYPYYGPGLFFGYGGFWGRGGYGYGGYHGFGGYYHGGYGYGHASFGSHGGGGGGGGGGHGGGGGGGHGR